MDPEPIEETKEEEQESVKEIPIVTNNDKPATGGHKSCSYMMKKGPRNGKPCGTPVFNKENDTCFRHTPKANKPTKQPPATPTQQPKQQATPTPVVQRPVVQRAGTRDDLARKLNAIADAAINKVVDEKKEDGNKGPNQPPTPPRPPPRVMAPPPRQPAPSGSFRSLPQFKEVYDGADQMPEEEEEQQSRQVLSPGYPPLPPGRRFRKSPINKHKVGELIFDKVYCGAIRKVEKIAHEKDWLDCRGAAAHIAKDDDVKNAWSDLVDLYFPDFLPEEVHPGIALVMASVGCIVAASTENKLEKVLQVPGYSKKRKRYEDDSSDDEEIRRPRPRKRHKSLSISQSSSDEEE